VPFKTSRTRHSCQCGKYAAHIGCKLINRPDIGDSLTRNVDVAQISHDKFVSSAIAEFRPFQVDAANPGTFCFKSFHQVRADESARPANDYSSVHMEWLVI
jgi:hypothetical protein